MTEPVTTDRNAGDAGLEDGEEPAVEITGRQEQEAQTLVLVPVTGEGEAVARRIDCRVQN